MMLELLDKIDNRLQVVTEELGRPEVITNQGKLKALSREHRQLEEIRRVGQEYRTLLKNNQEA